MQTTTTDGLLAVALPDGDGWGVETTAVDADGTHVAAIKCARTTPGELFFLIAKDYTVAPEHVADAEALLEDIYPEHYATLFTKVVIEELRELEAGWWEATYRFEHARLGEIVKRERARVIGSHVLLLSAEGSPAAVAAHAGATEGWFTGVMFATLAN